MAVWRAIAVGLVVFGTCVVPSVRGEDAANAPAQRSDFMTRLVGCKDAEV